MAPCPLCHQGALRLIAALTPSTVLRKLLRPPLQNPFGRRSARSILPEPTRREPRGRASSWPLRVVAAHWGRRARCLWVRLPLSRTLFA